MSKFGLENAHTKLVTLYKRSNVTNMFFDFLPTTLPHECLIKQACNFYFGVGHGNTHNLGNDKG